MNFIIFANDSLIDNRRIVFGDPNNYSAETLIPEVMKSARIYDVMIEYGNWGLKHLKKFPNTKSFFFFTCAFMPGVFKAFSGFTSLIENYGLGASRDSQEAAKIFGKT